MILDAVAEKMDTPIGVPMMEPAYSKPNPSLGEITRFAPYHHHNGGVWNHLNTWIMLAECQIGRPDRALDLFRRTFPPRLAQELERFTAPPFAYPSWVNTPRSRLYGKADLGWNTGTTVWAHRVLTEGFCGVQATYEGLRITPSLPVDWTCASLVRPYRGATYDITIHKPADLTTGRVQLELDGHCIEGDVLPLPTHSTHRVTAIIEPSNAAT
jgi:cellobiose phosphorylase